MRSAFLLALLALGGLPVLALAESPVIEAAEAAHANMGWRFTVTLRHGDTGWDHSADGWEVVDADGKRLGYRKLMHPHVHEQPFTRSLSSVMVPDGMQEVYIRARCKEEGWAGETVKVSLSR